MYDIRHNYMMLDRLKSDCDFYLGYGMRNAEYSLYCKDEKAQIKKMLHIYNSLTLKPVWLDVTGILRYAEQMKVNVRYATLLKTKDRVLRAWQKVVHRKELSKRKDKNE